MNSHRSLFFFLLLVIALGATLSLLYATPEGLGLSDDSIAYIAGARSILAGQGYREAWLASNQPVTHFPPAFSSALAFVGLSGIDPLRGARFLNALLFGVNAFLLGVIGWRMTKSQAAGIALALLFAVNATLFRVHAVAMSEPLYIFFSLAAFLSFHQYFTSPSPFRREARGEVQRWLVLTAVLVGAAYLTRYAGLALLATFIVALIVLHETSRQRLKSAALFLAGFLPFAAAWSLRNKLVADNATNRQWVFHPLSAENIEIGIYNFSEFLVPVEAWRRALVKIPNLFVAVLFILALTLFAWVAFKSLKKLLRPDTERPEVLSITNALYVFGYLASILSSMLLFDASTKFKPRINSPIYVALLILLVLFGHWLWQKRANVMRALVAFAFVFIFALSALETTSVVAALRKSGQGYASFQWYDSKAMEFLRALPEGTRIYTNQPGPVYLYTNRPCYVLPDTIDPVTLLPRENFEEGVANLQRDVLAGNAALALFKTGAEGEEIRSEYEILTQGLFLAHKSAGDEIYTGRP